MQRHIRNDSSEAVRPVQLWDSAVRANMSGPSSQAHPGRCVHLPLGSPLRHLNVQSKVQAGGLTLASGLTLETTWEGRDKCCLWGGRVAHSMGLSRTKSEGILRVGRQQ